MIFDKFYTQLIGRIAAAVAVLITSYKLKVPPYAGIASVILMLLIILFTDDGPGECYGNNVVRDYSLTTGKLEPSFWSWGCSRDLISEMVKNFVVTTFVMNMIIYARRQKQSERERTPEFEVTLNEKRMSSIA